MAYTVVTPSGSTNGKNVKVTGTNTGTAVTFHTADATAQDEVTLFAANTSATDVILTVEAGGTTSPDDHIKKTIPANSVVLVIPGVRYTGSVVIKAFAATGDVINLFGNVNRVT